MSKQSPKLLTPSEDPSNTYTELIEDTVSFLDSFMEASASPHARLGIHAWPCIIYHYRCPTEIPTRRNLLLLIVGPYYAQAMASCIFIGS